MRKKKKALPKKYGAPRGSARAKTIRKASKLYKSGKKQQAYRLREKMEEKERAKSKSKKTPKNRKRKVKSKSRKK
jgi:hypothetical protein